MIVRDPYVDEDDDSPLASGPLHVIKVAPTRGKELHANSRCTVAWWVDDNPLVGFRVVRTVKEET